MPGLDDSWSGPCDVCGEPTDGPFNEPLICDDCQEEFEDDA